ncbi:MAG: NrdH-redoxin [Anaerolineaceae bacterium]|nr:NrdH-redoxin [Anaerolineaceae bacterium]
MAETENQANQIIIYTTDWCPDCYRAKYLLDEYGIPYTAIDIDNDPAALAFVKQVNNGRRVVPTIVLPDQTILVEPSNALLAEKVGFEL